MFDDRIPDCDVIVEISEVFVVSSEYLEGGIDSVVEVIEEVMVTGVDVEQQVHTVK
jgi:hypothetical protein